MYGIDWRFACRWAYADSSLTFDLSFGPEGLGEANGLIGLGRVSVMVASVEKLLGSKSRGDGVRLKPFAGRVGTGRPAWGCASPAGAR